MAEQATVTIVPAVTERPHRVDRWFYISVALLMILFNVVAFGPSIIDASRRNVSLPLTPLVTVHAVNSDTAHSGARMHRAVREICILPIIV